MGFSSYCIHSPPASMATMAILTQKLSRPVCYFSVKTFFNVRKYILSKSNVHNFRYPSLKQKPRSLRKIGINQYSILVTTAQLEPLDLTEENVNQVLIEARSEFMQLFDSSVGITGVAELAELDGPFVKLRLKGRFWHERTTVLARLGTYLQKRIPEILEVDIEDEAQLDDSPENF